MRCAVLCVCDFNGDNGSRWRWTRSAKVIFIATGQSVACDRLQVRRKRRVKRVGQQRELELNALLQLNGNCVSFFKENCVAPQVIAQRCKLMVAPLSEGPGNETSLTCGPARFEEWINWKNENVLFVLCAKMLKLIAKKIFDNHLRKLIKN